MLERLNISTLKAIFLIGAITPWCCFASAKKDNGIPNAGNSFYPFFWAQSPTDSNDYGYNGQMIVTGPPVGTALLTSSAKFNLTGCPWWVKLVSSGYSSVTMVFQNVKPDSIRSCSSKFAAIPWFRSIRGQTDTNSYLIRFFFPVLPQNQSYSQFDFYSI